MQGMGSGVEMYKKGTSLLSHTLDFFALNYSQVWNNQARASVPNSGLCVLLILRWLDFLLTDSLSEFKIIALETTLAFKR